MEILLLLIRIFLAAIFLLAGIGKLLDLEGSKKAVKDFGVPDSLAKPIAYGLPIIEIVIAILLLSVSSSWIGAIGGFLLLLIFIGGMLWQMAKGNAPDCHCFGQIHSEPVSARSLIRNAIFAILAFFLVLQGKENQGLSLLDSTDFNSEGSFMSLILGFATVGLLAAVVFYLKKISEQQTQVIRRIEVLELISHEGGREVERENLAIPTEGLPIGAVVPDFELPDINGKIVEFEHLLAKAKPMLFLFVSPNCNPCAALLPEIEAWQNDLKGRLDFVFISSGNAKENLDKFAGGTLKQILLQKERETAELFGAQWTPTAVLINTDGKIASRIAAGDKAIRELVEKIKTEDSSKELVYVVSGNGHKLGEQLPDFSNTDIYDKNVTKKDLLGKKTLVTFWSQTCPYCVDMIDALRDWDSSKGLNEPNLLVLSEGEVESHKSMNLKSPIVVDNERKISKELGWNGTPSAVLLDEEGKIISETALGASQIWSLLGRKPKV